MAPKNVWNGIVATETGGKPQTQSQMALFLTLFCQSIVTSCNLQ